MRPLALLLLLASCGPTVVVEPYPDGAPYRRFLVESGHLHGDYEIFFPDGVSERKGEHAHGLRDGVWEFRWATGQMRSRHVYEEGVRHGHFEEWFENGSRQFEGDWVDGGKEGTWRHWDPDGKLIAEFEWEQGTRVGAKRF